MGYAANNSCSTETRVWTRGKAAAVHQRFVICSIFGVRTPLIVTDTVYSGEYEWRGVSQRVAEEQVEALYAGQAAEVGEDGSTGLKLLIAQPTFEGSETDIQIGGKPVMITMGTAAAEPMDGNLWKCRVSLNYRVTTIELAAQAGGNG